MTQGIRVLMGGEARTVPVADPCETVLEWLRRTGRVGTKEGCAEGDCGACTVVLGEERDGRLRYRAVNACIQFLPTLDGRQLITVEDLKGPDGALHPVQQAMVDAHGSQCGFCTPGIVMSLFALRHEAPGADRETAMDALAGNLCR
jgi:xanthine dehydrogenase small subunit